jgi:hypothetical protein
MLTRTRRTARTLAIAVITLAGVAASGNLAPAQQVGGFTPANPAFRTFLPPRQPGANPPARSSSPGTVQASPSIPSGIPYPFAAPNTSAPPFNPGFTTFEPPLDPPPAGPVPPRPSGSGFQFNPGWGVAPAGGFGQPLAPAALLSDLPAWAAMIKPAGEMVVERNGSRFYRVSGSELFYSPSAGTYLNPQTGVISRPSIAGLVAVGG